MSTAHPKPGCGYHLCQEKTAPYKCSYCNKYFCENHITPKKILLFSKTRQNDRYFMMDWHDTQGHPCAGYENYEQEKKDRKTAALNKILETPTKELPHPKPGLHPGHKLTKDATPQHNPYKPKYASLIVGILIVVLLTIAFMGLPKEDAHIIYDCRVYPDKCQKSNELPTIEIKTKPPEIQATNKTEDNPAVALPVIKNTTPTLNTSVMPKKITYWKDGVGWITEGTEYDKK